MTKPTVLICDDEESLRKAMRLVLEPDYQLLLAADGEEALKLLKQHPADLVLLDIKLPGMNGLDVLKELMAHPSPPRVVMLTAYESVELAQRATQSGALDYVTKPFERAALRKAVQRALSLKEWQRPSTPGPSRP